MRTKVNLIKYITIGVILTILIFIVVSCCISLDNTTETQTYHLNELKEGVYAIYYTTNSTAPAYNYEVVTLCCEGNVYTFKGKVSITYSNFGATATVIERPYLVYSDEISITVPYGTVEYAPSVNVTK